MTDLFGGWGGFATLAFFSDVVLILGAGWGFAQVSRAALQASLHPVTRCLALTGALLIFGLMMAKGLGLLK